MVTGRETNTVGLSEKMFLDSRFRDTAFRLSEILKTHGVSIKKLKATKGIWCRDYMPIQVGNNEFTQFRYEPSYLQDELELQSDPTEVCQANGIKPKFSQINLDGGNVVNWNDKAILTDRLFDENPEYSNKTKLIDELENLLQAQVIIIPQIKSST